MAAARRWTVVLAVLASLAPRLGAEEPRDVLRVRIPSKLVASQFPPDTPLRVLSPSEFEDLLSRVASADRLRARGGPRLVRARHHARFSPGLLSGRSELVLTTSSDAAVVPIEPWSPAVLGDPSPGAIVAASPSGDAVLVLEPSQPPASEVAIVLKWELRPRPDSRGRIFALALPGDETTTLTLDVPVGWEPSGAAENRERPTPAGPDRETWRFSGRIGGADLRLTNRTESRESGDPARIWVSGPTRIDLQATAAPAERAVNWTMNWTVQADEPGADSFTVEIDPGLELLGVEGPSVREYRVLDGPPARAEVALTSRGDGPTEIRFLAHARVPTEGSWTTPAIRPLPPLAWTGGATTVLLDEGRVIHECRERDGRRVPPPADAPPTGHVLTFESTTPGPAAELTFRAPGAAPVATVRGRWLLREAATRLECEVDGLGSSGSPPEQTLEIPAGWVVDRVEIVGEEDAPSWNQSTTTEGPSLLRLTVPSSDAAPAGRTIRIGATTSGSPRFPRTTVLPRVRPVAARIADEAWIAAASSRIELTPGETKGLAWIDPSQVPNLLPSPAPAESRPLLSWRWTAAQASAPVEVRLSAPMSTGRVHIRAQVEGGGRRLSLSGRAESSAAGDPTAIRLWLDAEPDEIPSWSFTDAATGRAVAATLLTEPLKRRLGLPTGGAAVTIPAEPDADGRVAIEFQSSRPWSGRGLLPLPTLPASLSPVGVAVIETPQAMRTLVEGEGVGRIEPELADRLAPGPDGASTPAGWVARALTYPPGAGLTLATEELRPEPLHGLIHEARLLTQTFPGGRSLNRLRLLVATDQTDTLRFKLPPGALLAGSRIDDRPAIPAVDGDSASLPLPAGGGERTRAVELDYRVEPTGPVESGRIRPPLPELGVPCLSFAWELALPTGESVADPGPRFTVESAEPRPAWPFGALGIARWRWPGERLAVRTPREDMLKLLDELSGEASDDLTFGALLTRWDAGGSAIVVDRSSLAAEGVGPRTRSGPWSPDRPGAWRSVQALQRRGLTLTMVDDVLVVTSRRAAASSSGPATWRAAVAEALLWGGDASDRFQSASRWRGEPAADDAPADGARGRRSPTPGRSTWRLSATSWPGPDASVTTSDVATRTAIGWIAALAVFVLGVRRLVSPRRGLIAPLLTMIVAVVVHDWSASLPPEFTAGIFTGAFGTLLIRMGRLLRSTLHSSRRSTSTPLTAAAMAGSTLRVRRGFRIGVGLASALGLSQAVGSQAPGPPPPIVALSPYDGEFDPQAPPSQVILRQEDYERLQRRSLPPVAGSGLASEPRLIAAEHRLSRAADQALTVVSEYTFTPVDTASRFDFPVGDVHDIEATLDDRRATVVVAPGGETAAVALPPGATRLVIRRTATPMREGGLESLELRINRSPSARLSLEQPEGARPVQHLAARGRVIAAEGRPIEALLGPVDRLSICWALGGRVADQPSATVEGLMLWDLDPAGERVRARLTYRTRRRTSTIRIGLEPGLVPRSVQIPGLVDTAWGGTSQNPEWIAHVDPPLPDRSTISMEFWRPLRSGATTDEAGPIVRRFPLVEPRGVDREAGLLAVRRPGRWTGRLEPPRDAEAVDDQTFVRAWGTLPDDPLTFAGTVRYNGREPVEFVTGPSPLRWRRRPSVRLAIDAGRIDWRCELELSEINGLLDHVELSVPDDLIILDVESPGLTDWSRRPEGPLHARFDRVDLKSRRSIRIRGWIPISQLTAGPGPRRHRLKLPWVDAADGAGSAGALEILSRSEVELASAPGGAAAATATEPAESEPSIAGWIRRSYRVDDPTLVGELSWAPPPPRSTVTIASQLTIHPDSAEWVAVLRYDVVGGPLDVIRLRLPSDWAAQGRIQAEGRDQPLVAESRDRSTTWTITPGRPVWGSRRLVLRSRMAIEPGREVAFPEVAPLGLGTVDASLALVFATASLPTTSGTAGLRPIPYTSRFQDEEFGGAVGLAPRAYHVDREGWTLSVQAPPGEPSGPAGRDSAAGVRSADLAIVIRGDGSALGLAEYQAEPRTGRFLTIAPPEGARLIRAAVDGMAVEPLLDADGRWTIPLGDSPARMVGVVWSTEGDSRLAGPSLPHVGDGRVPALLTVYAPAPAVVRSTFGGLEATGPERVELDRADRVGRRALDLVADMDRGSGRDRSRLVSLLIDHETTLREAEHALLAASRSVDRSRRDRAARDLEVVKSARDQLAESLRSTGMEEPIAWARYALGLDVDAPTTTAGDAPPVVEPSDRERLRRLGRPTFFAGVSPGLADPSARVEVDVDRGDDYPVVSESRARSLLLLALLLGLGLAGLTSARQAGAQSLIAAACLSLAAVAGGPLMLIACGAALVGGWFARPPSPREGRIGDWI